MSEQRRASFFVGNHSGTLGIGDWLRNFGKIFEWHGWELHISSRVDQTNLVVVLDEFSNPDFTDAFIRWSKDRPENSRLVLALSEFMSIGSGKHLRLNSFEHWTRELRPNRGMIKRPQRAISEPLGRSRYLAKRAVGLERVIREARIDTYITGHPAIALQLQDLHHLWEIEFPPVVDAEHPALIQGVFSRPLTDSSQSPQSAVSFCDDLGESSYINSSRFAFPVAIQGFTTSYRRRMIRELTRSGIHFAPLSAIQGGGTVSNYWGFDFVVPRTSSWPFTSPFRLLRSHSLGLIPVGLESWWPEDETNWRRLCLAADDVRSAVRLFSSASVLNLDVPMQKQGKHLIRTFGHHSIPGWNLLLEHSDSDAP